MAENIELSEAVASPDPVVSVHMITYNHAPYIAEAIEGVLRQKTSFPFELVIGEDCSTDGTREIVFDYQKKFPEIIRVITSEKNVGSRKNGLRTAAACRGKYIAFCEGDDYWHNPFKLQKQVDFLEGHPACGLVFSSYDVFDVRSSKKIGDFIKYKNWEIPENPRLADFLGENPAIGMGVLTCTIMARRIICEEVKQADPFLHQTDHFLMGDTQLWAEISVKASLHYIAESLATHNILEESMSTSKDINKTLRFSISCAELMVYLCNKYHFPQLKDKHEAALNDLLLRLAFQSRNGRLADKVLKSKKRLSRHEWLRYLGAKYKTIHYGYQAASSCINIFRSKYDKWK